MRLKFDNKVNVEIGVEVNVDVIVLVLIGQQKFKHAIFLPLRNTLEFHVWES